jgi:hypothetical protein
MTEGIRFAIKNENKNEMADGKASIGVEERYHHLGNPSGMFGHVDDRGAHGPRCHDLGDLYRETLHVMSSWVASPFDLLRLSEMNYTV